MPIIATDKGGGSFDPIPDGMHQAICYGVYDLGTQFNATFNKSQHKVLIQWEIKSQRIDVERDGKQVNLPRVMSKTYTLSLHEKANLRDDLESWRGRGFTADELCGFDLAKLLGVKATLQVIHVDKNGNTYANIKNVLPTTDQDKMGTTENTPRYFAMDEGHEIPADTPEWVVKIIHESDEWRSRNGVASAQYQPENAPPFQDDDPGPAFPSEVSGMDDVPF